MKFAQFVVAVLGFLAGVLPSVSEGGLITGVSSSNAAAVTATLSAGVGSESAPVSFPPFGTVNTGSMTIDIEVFQLHVPVALNFTYSAGGADFATTYNVTLNVKNSDPSSNAGRMTGFDVTNGAASTISQAIAPTSSVFFVQYNGSTYNIPGGFRWGGLSGGGPSIGFGQTAANNTFSFTMNWGGSTGAAVGALNFVANPEPTTLLLGSLVLAPAAWVVRRRRKANAELESAPV